MSYWDTSALVKLFLVEADTATFERLAFSASQIVTGWLARLEARTVFRRREAEGSLRDNEAAALWIELEQDKTRGRIVVLDPTQEIEQAFAQVLDECFSQQPPIFIRTNDALHLAAARVSGETEFVTGDQRQGAAARLLGFTVLP